MNTPPTPNGRRRSGTRFPVRHDVVSWNEAEREPAHQRKIVSVIRFACERGATRRHHTMTHRGVKPSIGRYSGPSGGDRRTFGSLRADFIRARPRAPPHHPHRRAPDGSLSLPRRAPYSLPSRGRNGRTAPEGSVMVQSGPDPPVTPPSLARLLCRGDLVSFSRRADRL